MQPGLRGLLVHPSAIFGSPPPCGGQFALSANRRAALLPKFMTNALGVFCVNTNDRVVGITYDDGPDPEHTPKILDVLADRGATATFFVLADQAERHPEVVARIVAEGHEIGLHGGDHRQLLKHGVMSTVADIRAARRRVEAVSKCPLKLYRPTYGEFTWAQAIALSQLGLEIVLWSNDAGDWLHNEEGHVAAKALAGVFPGGIMLLHDRRGDPETLEPGQVLPAFNKAEVLSLILEGLHSRGFRTKRAGDMLKHYQPVRSRIKEWMTRP
jgi:peptidoglycan/xylan/chitin deacetylase (PgdA/CDA1 family)